MLDHDDRPLVFLDVDGPLIPFRARPAKRRQPTGGAHDASGNPLVDRLDPDDGRKLLGLGCQLVWATTWMADANEIVSPRLGLPPLPVVEFPDTDDEPVPGLHWKTVSLTQWATGRPFIWIDDETTDLDRQWIDTHHLGSALVHRVDPYTGLTDADFSTIRRWLAEQQAAGNNGRSGANREGGSVSKASRRAGVDAARAAQATASYDAVTVAQGAVWWLESLPAEGGRTALMRLAVTADGITEATPPNADVGSSVHAYGGGTYALDDMRIWYVDGNDGQVHTIDSRTPSQAIPGCGPKVITGYGDLTPYQGQLLAVGEADDGDRLVQFAADSASACILARTDGFFAAPRPNGERLAWLSWGADRMPWDATQLKVARLHRGELSDAVLVAGGDIESVLEPQWNTTHGLTFLSDRTGWWNLYAWDGTGVRPVVTMNADVAAAPWRLGYSSYLHLPGGRIAMTVHDGPRQRLIIHHPDGHRQQIDLPFTTIKPYLAADQSRLYCIGSAPTVLPQVIAVDLGARDRWRPLSRPQSTDWAGTDPTLPTHVSIAGAGGHLNALLYPPHRAGEDWSAPTVIRAHPGPTASMTLRPDAQVQYLCSHGFAVVDVDYRGSTGYSRAFRQELHGQWGTADVNDCVAVAEHLITAGRTTRGQVFITGASAGGYTALHAISRSDVFAGAVARSAIIDPARWQQTAPRWQRPHAAILTGPAGPIRAEAIQQPVLLIHGADDHVAPLSDVTELADALAALDKPHDLLVLGTAGHEFGAKNDTVRALEAELAFYRDRLRAPAP